MRDLIITEQRNIYVNVTVDKFRLLEFNVNPTDKEVTVRWQKGTVVEGNFAETTSHLTVFDVNNILTDGQDLPAPVANPYNTLVVKINTGDFSPEANLLDFMEYVLTNYAEI